MDDDDMIRKLNSVGKAIFIEYFSTFKSYAEGRLSRADCIEILVSNEVSNDAGAAIRVSNAKLLFDGKRECDALEVVAKSKRLSPDIIRAATQLLNE